MIKIENTEVVGWEATIRGMRNPKNSWDKSDSYFGKNIDGAGFVSKQLNVRNDISTDWMTLGSNDHELMIKLAKAGTDHRKFMRMIDVYLDITAPLYWWKEFDTYKVGTVANSCSTMHKIADKAFTIDDFSHEHLNHTSMKTLKDIIDRLNVCRRVYNDVKGSKGDKEVWWQMIQLLPSSYNQRRTVKLNYEVLANIYKSRKGHKLDEWREFCEWVENLPYSELITSNK